jgi:hypothetical protein
MGRRIEEERLRVEAEYRRVLRTSVEFERRIRNRWREKCRQKNVRIRELEARVAELERRLERRERMADRATKERKLVALMVNDLEANISEPEMVEMESEVRGLPDEELNETLAIRLELSDARDEEALDRALAGVQEPEIHSEGGDRPGGFTGAPDMSHEGRPEERGE